MIQGLFRVWGVERVGCMGRREGADCRVALVTAVCRVGCMGRETVCMWWQPYRVRRWKSFTSTLPMELSSLRTSFQHHGYSGTVFSKSAHSLPPQKVNKKQG